MYWTDRENIQLCLGLFPACTTPPGDPSVSKHQDPSLSPGPARRMQESFLLLGPVTVCTDVSGGGSPRRSLTLLGSREGRSSNWGRGRSRDQSHFLISFGLSFVSRVKNKVGGWGIGAGQDPCRTTSESIRPLLCFISPPLGPYAWL